MALGGHTKSMSSPGKLHGVAEPNFWAEISKWRILAWGSSAKLLVRDFDIFGFFVLRSLGLYFTLGLCLGYFGGFFVD